jgi:hypothetical protein
MFVATSLGIGFAAGAIDYTIWSDGANYNEFSSSAITSATLTSFTLTPVSAVPEVNELTVAACAAVVGLFVSFRRWRKLAR